MTRSELIDAIAARQGIDRAAAERVVRTIFDTLVEGLVRGDHVELRGFGSFTIREHGGYRGRNPRSGELVEVGPKRSPHFKVGRPLRARIESPEGEEPRPALAAREGAE
jgi:integration host factor subunit beta